MTVFIWEERRFLPKPTPGTASQHGTMAKRDRPQRSVRHFCHPKRASWGIWMSAWEGRHAMKARIVWRGLVLVRFLGQANVAFWRCGPWVNLSLPLRKQDHMCWSQDWQEKSQCLVEALQTASQAWKNTSGEKKKRERQRSDIKSALKKAVTWQRGSRQDWPSCCLLVASITTNPLPNSTGRKKRKRDKRRKKRGRKKRDENRGTCYSTR